MALGRPGLAARFRFRFVFVEGAGAAPRTLPVMNVATATGARDRVPVTLTRTLRGAHTEVSGAAVDMSGAAVDIVDAGAASAVGAGRREVPHAAAALLSTDKNERAYSGGAGVWSALRVSGACRRPHRIVRCRGCWWGGLLGWRGMQALHRCVCRGYCGASLAAGFLPCLCRTPRPAPSDPQRRVGVCNHVVQHNTLTLIRDLGVGQLLDLGGEWLCWGMHISGSGLEHVGCVWGMGLRARTVVTT